MFKAKVALSSMVVASVLVAVVATTATAFPGPFYYVETAKVGGQGAAKGVSIAVKTGSAVKLVSKYLGVPVEAECTTVKAESAVIYNTTLQGEAETKRLIYEGCTFKKPEGCKITGGKFSTVPVYSYLDYEKEPSAAELEKKEFLVPLTEYFLPKEGTTFAEISIEGGICGLVKVAKLTGTVVSKVSPEGKEAKEIELPFPSPAITRTWDTVEGSKFKEYSAGLKLEGEPAIMSGTLVAQLQSGEKFGVFDE